MNINQLKEICSLHLESIQKFQPILLIMCPLAYICRIQSFPWGVKENKHWYKWIQRMNKLKETRIHR